jgi:hypothetical protein
MKIKIITLAIAFFTVVTAAEAKVYYQAKELRDVQVYTIKGFCYNVSHSVKDPAIEGWRATFAKSLVWLDKLHKDPKTYHLEKIKGVESKTIRDAIDIIIQVLDGKYPNITPEIALREWVLTGRRVVATYVEQTVVNSKTNKKEKHIKWQFYLKAHKTNSDPQQIQKLLYRYQDIKLF